MDLSKFVHNDVCPVCGNTLTLFAQAINSVCFKATKFNGSNINFTQEIPEKIEGAEERFILKVSDSKAQVYMTSKIKEKYDLSSFFFFQLCNLDSIIVKKTEFAIDKYEINALKVCCRRSTRKMDIVGSTNNLNEFVIPNGMSVIRSERFGFSRWINDNQKVYILSLDHDTDTSRLWHYTCTREQMDDKKFEPKVFFKDIGALKKNINLEDQQALMDRFDAWILMS